MDSFNTTLLVVPLALIGAAVLFFLWRVTRRDPLTDLARSLGARRAVSPTPEATEIIVDRRGPMEVRVVPLDRLLEAARVEVRAPDLPPHLTLDWRGSAADKSPLTTGVRGFDERVQIDGDPVEAQAALGAPARAAITAVLERGAAFIGGAWRMNVADAGAQPSRVAAAIDSLCSATEALGSDGIAAAERVVEMMAADPEPGYRGRCIEVLAAGGCPELEAAVRHGVDDPDEAVRFIAACHARARLRHQTLQALVTDAEDPLLRADALALLAGFGGTGSGSGPALMSDTVVGAARAAASDVDPRVRKRGIEVLVAANALRPSDAVALIDDPDSMVRETLVRMGSLPLDALVTLSADPAPTVAMVAATELGHRGTPDQITLMLAQAADQPGPVKRALEKAVEAIRGRTG